MLRCHHAPTLKIGAINSELSYIPFWGIPSRTAVSQILGQMSHFTSGTILYRVVAIVRLRNPLQGTAEKSSQSQIGNLNSPLSSAGALSE